MLKITEILSSLPDWFRWILYPLHFMGKTYGYLLLLPTVYWCISRKKGEELIIILFISALAGAGLKLAVQEIRPYIQYPEIVSNFVEEPTFSFPSAHSIFYGALGTWLFIGFSNVRIRAAAIILIIIGGLSRIVYGVHFPQDVLAGWLIGIMTAAGVFWVRDKGAMKKIKTPLLFITVMNILLASVLFIYAVLTSDDFEQRKNILNMVGTFSGLLWGFGLIWKALKFSARGNAKHTILKLLCGFVLLVPLYFLSGIAFDLLFPEPVSVFGCLVYLARYIIIGFSAAYLIPQLFIKMKILKAENDNVK